jgi:hypothetical protein
VVRGGFDALCHAWDDVRMTEAPHSPGSADEQPGLSENEKRLLDFERSWWSAGTGRDEAVREQLGMGAADYHRAVNDLIDKPEALAYDGVLVRRLRRQRDSRRTQRSKSTRP